MFCKVCGVPVGITRGNMWHADGSIAGRFPPHIKGTFFDADELGSLFRAVSEHVDYDIGDIVARGKYHDAREYMAALVEKMAEASGGKLPPDEELYRMMLVPTRIWGIAEVEYESIETERIVVRVKDPYSVPLLCGDVAGVADAVTGRENKATWVGDEREGLMTVVPAEGYAAASAFIDDGGIGYGRKSESGELQCERCEECGAPKGVSGLFAWQEGGCRILERSSGRRYCFNNTRGITVVLRMLVGELGEDVEEKMVEFAREYSRSLYEEVAGDPGSNGGRSAVGLEEHLESFPYRGWGRATGVSRGEEGLAVEVENPYSDIMLSGRIWGMAEACGGRELRLSRRESDESGLRLQLQQA